MLYSATICAFIQRNETILRTKVARNLLWDESTGWIRMQFSPCTCPNEKADQHTNYHGMVSVVCVVAIVCTSMMFGERLILYIRSEISTCIKFMWLTRLLLGLLYVSQINALCSNTSQSCRCTLPITSDDGTTTVQTPIDSAEGRQRVVPTDESSSLHVEKTVPGGRESNLLRSSFDIQ